MTHIVAGYPAMRECERLANVMSKYVDFIEIQIPFSDPVADGPTIMAANGEALKNGVSVEDCFRLMERLVNRKREISAVPKFLFMSYYNILHHYGVEKFCKRARKCGCYGLISPDIPIDEEKNEGYLKACKKYGLMPIQVISPLTPEKRMKKIAKLARGFVYCVARYGTTGQSMHLNSGLSAYLGKVKKDIKLPLAVGFGISKKEHVKEVWKYADIAVIGSKIIDILKNGDIAVVEKFLVDLRI